jgi:precorrin-3B C17-methyltransferase
VVGYTTYIDLIRPLIEGKTVISTGMTREVDRVSAAIDAALAGGSCAIVSSGDPGIYAMAGLALEICRFRGLSIKKPGQGKGDMVVEVVPGIPALGSGAALLGAPLTHDFAAISLSDLLTPWEVIEARLEAAAAADFVIVLYNPKSRRRQDHLEKAQQIILRYRKGGTPVGVVSRAMREGQSVRILPLDELHLADVDMQTTVFVGNRSTVTHEGFMITPRGYGTKYDLDPSAPGDGK